MRRLLAVAFAGSLALLTASGVQAGNGSGTVHLGPFPSTSPDGSTCGPSWADDTFDRSFTVHDNGDGTFKVTEDFKNGTFVTRAGPSPGACESSNHHGSTVAAGIEGGFQGFLSGTVTSANYNPDGCTPATCSTLVGFMASVFPGGTFTCLQGFGGCVFNFEYHSNDQSLEYHHWQDKSDNADGEQFIGDIANE